MRIAYLLLLGPIVLACVPAALAAQCPISATDRPATDTARDADRKPAELLAFAGVKSGDRIADIMPGTGYFSRIFSHLVGPKGQVYAIVPAELAQIAPKLAESARALASDPAYQNISVSVTPTASFSAASPLDLAWTSDNYHDLYFSVLARRLSSIPRCTGCLSLAAHSL